MNWVFILVVLILLYHIVRGYKRGLLRIAYSLVSWIIVLVFVMWATPYVKSYIMENTSVFERIQNSCSEQLRNSMQEKQEAQLEDDAGDAVNGELAELGIGLPDSVITGLLEKAGGAADTLFEESGIACLFDRRVVILLKLESSRLLPRKEAILEELQKHLQDHYQMKDDAHYARLVLDVMVDCLKHVLTEHENMEDAKAEFLKLFRLFCTGILGQLN